SLNAFSAGFHARGPNQDASPMSDTPKLGFTSLKALPAGVLVLFCDQDLKFGPVSRRLLARTGDLIKRAAVADRFTGKRGSALDIVAPAGLDVPRLVVVGTGKAAEQRSTDFVKLGGMALGKVPTSAPQAAIVAELSGGAIRPEQAADLALGVLLRGYSFERYKTKRKEG